MAKLFLFVRAPGLYEWPCILAMCIFSIIFYVFLYSHTVQINVVVVAVVCSFRARQPLLLLVTPLLLSNLVPRGFSVFKIAWLRAYFLAIHTCSPRLSPLLFDRNADEMKKKSCKINILPR